MMDLNKLSRAGENIRLSDDAKKRIIAACAQKLPDNPGEYTDIVMSVERYKPRPIRRFAAIAAVCVLAAGGTAALFTMKNIGSKAEKNTPGAAIESYTGKAVKEPGDMYQTHLMEFFWNKCNGNGRPLSDVQCDRLYELFSGLTYTELDDCELQSPSKHILEYTIDIDDYYQDGYYWACIEGDILVTDLKSTYQPKTNNKQCYRLSENIEERFDEICNEEFSLVLDNDFYCLEEGDVSKEAKSEITDFLRGLDYGDISTTKQSSDSAPLNGAASVDLNFSCEEYDCNLHISGCTFTYTIDYTGIETKKQHIENRLIASDCYDAAATVLAIYKNSKSDPKNRESADNEALAALKDVFQNRNNYYLGHKTQYSEIVGAEISEAQYEAVAELMNRIIYTSDKSFDPAEYGADKLSDNLIRIVYRDIEHPANLYEIDIFESYVRSGKEWFKTNEPELCTKIQAILIG